MRHDVRQDEQFHAIIRKFQSTRHLAKFLSEGAYGRGRDVSEYNFPDPVRGLRATARQKAAGSAILREHHYLIERAGGYAVTQVYADGFDRLTPASDYWPTIWRRRDIAGDPIYYDQIAPYGIELKQLLEGIWTHPAGIEPSTSREASQLHQTGVDLARQLQSGQRQKIHARVYVRPIARRGAPRAKNGANFGVKSEKDLDAHAFAPGEADFRCEVQDIPHRQDTASRAGRYHRQRQQSLRQRYARGGRKI